MPYINYTFVAWHLYFATAGNIKLSYPSIAYEVRITYIVYIIIIYTYDIIYTHKFNLKIQFS